MNHPRHQARHAAIAALLAASLAGCVTETIRPRRGIAVRPAAASDPSRGATPVPAAVPPGTAEAALPPGPVASPARSGRTVTSRVQVEIAPLGSVPYDGQVLPLVSPDGRFMAVQEGEAPGWPALLAGPDAVPPTGCRVVVYNLSTVPLTRVETELPPQGVVLGRSADSTGYLVELLRDDGSRWIGRASWVTGRVEWLVQGPSVNSHAVWTPGGGLAFSRREPGEDNARLVLRWTDGSESILSTPDASYEFPMSTGEPGVLFALVRGAGRTDVEAVRIRDDDSSPGRRRLGSPLARRTIARSDEPAMAFQIAAPVAADSPRSDADGDPAPRPLVFFHPQFGRMAAYDWRAGRVRLLAANSMAAAAWNAPDASGYFCATPEGLVFVPDDPAGESRAGSLTELRVLAGAYVPRRTTDPARPILLFSPDAREPDRLRVIAMKPAVPEDAESPAAPSPARPAPGGEP